MDHNLLNKQFNEAKPFRHVVIDNFLADFHWHNLLTTFPHPNSDWYTYDNPFEKKRAIDRLDKMPGFIMQELAKFNTHIFIDNLEKITGIEGLIPDPSFRGGGMHQILPGGKLDVHVDFNYHQKLKLDRRLNVILYLNEDWKEEYGGHLELWNSTMTQCEKRILPIANRLVIFETTETSFHGHPDPVTCPEGMTRKSLALYYYTNGRPENEKVAPHSTKFQMRPTDQTSAEIEALRQKRNEGRLK